MNLPKPRACRRCDLEFQPVEEYQKDYCQTCEETIRDEEREKNLAAINKKITEETPPRFLATDTGHPAFNRMAWARIQAWKPTAENPWLGLVGATGTCKTRMAYLLAGRILVDMAAESAMRRCRPPSFEFVSAYDIGAAVLDQFRDDRQAAALSREFLSSVRKCRVLLLDDLGKCRFTPAVASEFFALIDHRHENNMVTLWTSNSSPEEVAATLPEDMAGPLAGRLNDCSTIFKLK
ncbi:MAG: ATP-binding protein [Verrucomicrobia bacterium]|nr:ATP-binding protein [Verrucomicrobiota bacterium]